MSIDTLRAIFGWCAVINMGLLLWWFLIMAFARDWVYKVHTRWFEMSKEQFNAIHYSGIMFFKILVFVMFIIPYIVLRIMG